MHLEGSFTDANHNSGSYFGFKATYTTTRGDKFFFDDVSISPLVVDVIPPSIDSVGSLDGDKHRYILRRSGRFKYR